MCAGCHSSVVLQTRVKDTSHEWKWHPLSRLCTRRAFRCVFFTLGRGAQHQNAWHTPIWMTVFLTAGSVQGSDTLTHITHRAAHVGNSIFIIRLGEVLPYSTQSRETKTREGGGGGQSGNKAEVSFLLMTCELKEEHREKCSLYCWISPHHSTYNQWPQLKSVECVCVNNYLLSLHSGFALHYPCILSFCFSLWGLLYTCHLINVWLDLSYIAFPTLMSPWHFFFSI